jgi:hypothetical protein
VEAVLKSWSAEEVGALVQCYGCGKMRCIFSPTKSSDEDRQSELERRIETTIFQCGDLLFPDRNEEYGMVFLQRANLSCRNTMEREYYNVKDRRFKTKEICFHCGLEDGVFTHSDLQTLGITGGVKNFPICEVCVEEGKKPIKIAGEKRNVVEAVAKQAEAKKRRLAEAKANGKKKEGNGKR